MILKTTRLILRPWKEEDFEPFAKLNADPRVMEYFPETLFRAESDRLAEKLKKHIEEKGWGLWAVEVPGVSEFIGFIGLNETVFPAHFTPAVEVGWRLAFDYWGKGYATEGAKAALDFGFNTLGLDEIVSFTSALNIRSHKVMEKIGMAKDSRNDFNHPNVPVGSPLKPHVLYRLTTK